MQRTHVIAFALAAVMFAASSLQAQTILPKPDPPFKGQTGLTAADSDKDFPAPVTAPEGAPNILLILTDDVGFGASDTFGGPVRTPTFSRVAGAGLRFNKFHTTALCSPTRAALLTGRNHHSVATGSITECGTGYPGYTTVVPQSKRGLGDILKLNGYNTAWFGKNHNVPDWQTSQAGPFDLWPTGLGFEYFYGFIGGDTNQWAPAIFENTTPVELPPGEAGEHFDKVLADKCIDWLRMQNSVAPDKPFFAYYAPGSTHAPHHAPKEWIDKYAKPEKGFENDFPAGWDEQRKATHAKQIELGIIPADTQLTVRSQGIGAWDDIVDGEPGYDGAKATERKEVYTRMMQVYAAALSHCDHNIGRVITAIEEMEELDNTLIIYIMGDNGASAEGSADGLVNEMTFLNDMPVPFSKVLAAKDDLGGPKTYNHYPIGWAHAMCTPFQWTKQIGSHFGGTRNAMAISWPAAITPAGEVKKDLRQQFHHAIDIMPTLLEAVGIEPPAKVYGVDQAPVEGVSMVYAFNDADAEPRRTTQYFEMFANRAIYEDGWVAATTPPAAPWEAEPSGLDVIESFPWELYNIGTDFSQAKNLMVVAQTLPGVVEPQPRARGTEAPDGSEEEEISLPERLEKLKQRFYIEAVKFNVLPLDFSKTSRLDTSNRPSNISELTKFDYYDGMVRIPEGSAPDLKNKSFSITAKVSIPNFAGDEDPSNNDVVAEGVILTQGGRFSGLGLYFKDGKPVFHYNNCGVERTSVEGGVLAHGDYVIKVDFVYKGGDPGSEATVTLLAGPDDDNLQAAAPIQLPSTIPYRMSLDETLDIGEDTGTSVNPADYGGEASTPALPFKFNGTLKSVTIEYTDLDKEMTPAERLKLLRGRARAAAAH